MKKPSVFLTLAALLFNSGCQTAGVISVFGTSRRHEREIAAEYDLAEHKDQRILVLVNQPAYLNAQVNLRFHLTDAINKNLTEKVEIGPQCLVGYNELSEFRSNRADFSLLSPVEVGTALDANMVLLVVIEDYQLNAMPEAGYYQGLLSARAVLFETATGEKLWPESEKSKSVKVGFEVEEGGREVSVRRLVSACAYCTVRYFYDCPEDKFKIADDRSSAGWKDWGK